MEEAAAAAAEEEEEPTWLVVDPDYDWVVTTQAKLKSYAQLAHMRSVLPNILQTLATVPSLMAPGARGEVQEASAGARGLLSSLQHGWSERMLASLDEPALRQQAAAVDVRLGDLEPAFVQALVQGLDLLVWLRTSFPQDNNFTARPAPSFTPRSVRRALLTPQVHTGSRYRCGKEHLRAACGPRQEEKGA